MPRIVLQRPSYAKLNVINSVFCENNITVFSYDSENDLSVKKANIKWHYYLRNLFLLSKYNKFNS